MDIGKNFGIELLELQNKMKKMEEEEKKKKLLKERRKYEVVEVEENAEVDESVVWDKQKLDYYNYTLENGLISGLPSPYQENRFGYRKPKLKYEMSEEELSEYEKCALDVIYFAENYCYTMTDLGQNLIKLRPYQLKVLKVYMENRNVMYLSSRQMGKTTTASIFLLWYACFHLDRNTLVMADKGDTMIEVLEKISIMYEYLPFFLKPGIVINQVKKKVFDNGCRIIGQNTTQRAARGFTVHFLYCDEFAHIPPKIAEKFYESVWPTLSSSEISRCIITSTPNGTNKFYDLYDGALTGKNEYFPMRTDWWEFPGRDENWKQKQIANLGSEEAFDKEFGCKFFTGKGAGVVSDTAIGKLELNSIRPYTHIDFPILDRTGVDYSKLEWNTDYLETIDNDFPGTYIVSVDLSHGVGKNYTVINIFKIEPFSENELSSMKIDDGVEYVELFKLKQIGVLRDNFLPPDKTAQLLSVLCFDIFNPDRTMLVIEENMGFEIVYNTLEKREDFFEEIFYHSYYSRDAKHKKPGIKIHRNNKPLFITTFRDLIQTYKIEITHKLTLEEIRNLVQDSDGNYIVSVGNDDLLMTCSNLASLFLDETVYDLIDDNRSLITDEEKRMLNKAIYKNEYYEAEQNSYDEFDFLDDF